MRYYGAFFRALRLVLPWAAMFGTGALRVDAFVPAPAPQDEAAPDKITLGPELEAKLKQVLDKAQVARSHYLGLQMNKEIEDVAGATGLGDAGKQALAPAAKQAVEASVEGWLGKLADIIRKELVQQQPAQASVMLDQIMAQVDVLAQTNGPLQFVQPFEEDVWTKALRQTLTPAQSAAWDKVLADRKDQIEKQVGTILDQGVKNVRAQQLQQILAQCRSIEIALGLPKDRADKLENLAGSVVDQTAAMWRKRVESMILSMNENTRRQVIMNGNIFFGPEEGEAPLEQASWKEGMAKLLTPEEMARLQSTQEARQLKRAHVMGQIMIMMLDDKVAFTPTQRRQLQPIADRLVKNMPELFQDPGINGNFNCQPMLFYAAATKATEAELKPILDEAQLRHWQHLSETEGVDLDMPQAMPPARPDDQFKPEDINGPEDVEKVISNFLYQAALDERKHILEENMVRAEDVIRSAGLSGAAAARLQDATLGATEDQLNGWKWFMEQQVRNQLQDVTPQNLKQRMENLQNFLMQFRGNFRMMMNLNLNQFRPMQDGKVNPGIWEKTVQSDLTAAQQAAWQKQTDEREAFREQAITSLIMMEFDRKIQLTPDQGTKLEPLVSGVLRDYTPDIARVFAGSGDFPGYIANGCVLMPLAGVSTADFQAILTKDQWKLWSESPDCINASNLWQGVRQFHNQRVKAN
jgi:hypothetical protein